MTIVMMLLVRSGVAQCLAMMTYARAKQRVAHMHGRRYARGMPSISSHT